MFCEKCGQKLNSRAVRCGKCGAYVKPDGMITNIPDATSFGRQYDDNYWHEKEREVYSDGGYYQTYPYNNNCFGCPYYISAGRPAASAFGAMSVAAFVLSLVTIIMMAVFIGIVIL